MPNINKIKFNYGKKKSYYLQERNVDASWLHAGVSKIILTTKLLSTSLAMFYGSVDPNVHLFIYVPI